MERGEMKGAVPEKEGDESEVWRRRISCRSKRLQCESQAGVQVYISDGPL